MNKVKTQHLIAYIDHLVEHTQAEMADVKDRLQNYNSRTFIQKTIDGFRQLLWFFHPGDCLEYKAQHLISIASKHQETLAMLKYHAHDEYIDWPMTPYHAPGFYKFCAENNLTS